MPSRIKFTVLGHPEPQGSIKAFMVRGKPRLTSDNAAMKPWRQEVGWCALRALAKANAKQPWAAAKVPVGVIFHFYFAKPHSAPKRRQWPSVKPDWDKLARSCGDAMTGIVWVDDAQIVQATVVKEYGLPERAEITIEIVEDKSVN